MVQPSKTATASSAPAVDPLLGRVINGRFKILSVVARGGMGKVYRAEQSPLGRVVALKVLNPNYSGENDPEFHKRFFLEASIVARLSHSNTVTLYDYGQTDDGVYFMAMELLEGRTLHRRLRDEGPIDAARALHITLQVCRSLREAHGLGVIHRDLKPANIFLLHRDDDRDFVKVLDFGLVKLTDSDGESLTQTGLFMGSPKYMAPEQIRGEKVSPATDVYSLGVILFEMLTGRVPFDKPNSVNLLMAHVSDPVPALTEVKPDLSVPAAVEDLVYRCLSKSPEDRFASMDELIAAIKHTAQGTLPMGAMLSGTGDFFASLAPPAMSSGEQLARASTPPALPAASRSPLPPPLPLDDDAAPSITAEPAPSITAHPAPAPLPTPLPAPLPVASTSPPPPRSPGPVALGLFALSVAVGAALYTLRRPCTAAPLTSPTVVLRAPRALTVAIDSDPSGADVFEGEVLLGRTPLRMTWQGDRADPAVRHTFTVRAAGFETVTVDGQGPAIAHAVRLRASTPSLAVADAADAAVTPAANARRPRPRVIPRAPGEPAPTGYRDNVY
ncbi:MAG: serine/threonine-protein kinase [Polyangiales bacterium]